MTTDILPRYIHFQNKISIALERYKWHEKNGSLKEIYEYEFKNHKFRIERLSVNLHDEQIFPSKSTIMQFSGNIRMELLPRLASLSFFFIFEMIDCFCLYLVSHLTFFFSHRGDHLFASHGLILVFSATLASKHISLIHFAKDS